MTFRQRFRVGATLIEVLVVLSIISTLAIIGVSTSADVSAHLREGQCREHLLAIQSALVRYRQDNRGQDPERLEDLVPGYIQAVDLVCPEVMARAPDAVAALNESRHRRHPNAGQWVSYFYFRRVRLDRAFQTGRETIRYSDILRDRGGETPVVVCLDHREPHSLWYMGGASPQLMTSWYAPERPVLVLRQNGSVGVSHYGGLIADGLNCGTLELAVNL